MTDSGVRNELSGSAVNAVQAGHIGEVNLFGGVPAPAKPAVVPHQLPAAVSVFADREDVLEALVAQMNAPAATVPVVVLTGVNGVGKTAVSVRFGHQQQERFPDGQLYADLSSRDVSDVTAGFLGALGVSTEWIPATFADRVSQFRSLTSGRRILVVLDDVAEAAQLRVLRPTTPGSMLLATCARADVDLLTDGPYLRRLEPLSAQHGQQLLAELLGADRVAAEPDAARRLVDLCAGLPIAIRVAAARLRVRPASTIKRLVTGLESGDVAEVTSVFNDAYAMLGPASARCFRVLALLPGRRVPVGAVAAALHTGGEETLDLLGDLHDAGLVQWSAETGFALHDVLRAVARSRLRAVDGESVAGDATVRMIDWFLLAAAAADREIMGDRLRLAPLDPLLEQWPATGRDIVFTDKGDALNWFATHHADLHEVVRIAARHGQDRQVWQLVEALWPSHTHLRTFSDWLEACELGLAAAMRLNDPAAAARMLQQHARASIDQGDHGAAIHDLERAREYAAISGNERLTASVWEFIAIAARASGDPGRALDSARISLEIHQRLGRKRGIALQYYEIGACHLALHQPDAAIAALRQAEALLVEVDDERTLTRVLQRLGHAYTEAADFDAADAALARCVALCQRHHLRAMEAQAWERRGDTASAADDAVRAHQHWARALAIYDAGHHPDADILRQRLNEVQP